MGEMQFRVTVKGNCGVVHPSLRSWYDCYDCKCRGPVVVLYPYQVGSLAIPSGWVEGRDYIVAQPIPETAGQ